MGASDDRRLLEEHGEKRLAKTHTYTRNFYVPPGYFENCGRNTVCVKLSRDRKVVEKPLT